MTYMSRKKYSIPKGESKRDYYDFKKPFNVNDLILPFEFEEVFDEEEVAIWQESKSL